MGINCATQTYIIVINTGNKLKHYGVSVVTIRTKDPMRGSCL